MRMLFIFVVALVSAVLAAPGKAQQTTPCDGYLYAVEKPVDHPGVPAEATICASFRLLTLVGDDYDRSHFERALADGGYKVRSLSFNGKPVPR